MVVVPAVVAGADGGVAASMRMVRVEVAVTPVGSVAT
jgi:hypothetical protein